MTLTHEPVHRLIHRPVGTETRPRPRPRPSRPAEAAEPAVDVFYPRRGIRVDTTFWQHRSIFAGTQEQLDQLHREADARAAARAREEFLAFVESERAQARPTLFELHRPAIRRLQAVVHVGLVPLLWNITTCKCGGRWPCNTVKQYFRHRLGWTTDITEPLKTLTRQLPKPATRWSRLRRLVARFRGVSPGGRC